MSIKESDTMKRITITSEAVIIIVAVLVVVAFIAFIGWIIFSPSTSITYYSYKGRFIKCEQIEATGTQTKTICVDH